jgi:hypothetical protein
MTYEPGARLHARIYSERCDLSPDGKYLCYLTMNPGTDWAAGETYVAISRLPWLFALAAWDVVDTWSRGMCFVDRVVDRASAPVRSPQVGSTEVGSPEVGSVDALPFGLRFHDANSFAVERRRGWIEHSSTPLRADDDMWDERRNESIQMIKPNFQTGTVLHIQGGAMASFGYGELNDATCPKYSLEFPDGQVEVLAGVQWADWSADGRLLVATLQGELQIRENADVIWRYDTANDPSRRVAPPEARVWA